MNQEAGPSHKHCSVPPCGAWTGNERAKGK